MGVFSVPPPFIVLVCVTVATNLLGSSSKRCGPVRCRGVKPIPVGSNMLVGRWASHVLRIEGRLILRALQHLRKGRGWRVLLHTRHVSPVGLLLLRRRGEARLFFQRLLWGMVVVVVVVGRIRVGVASSRHGGNLVKR